MNKTVVLKDYNSLISTLYERYPNDKDIKEMANVINGLVKRLNLLRHHLTMSASECGSLHHDKKHYHEYNEPCPLEKLIEEALS